MVTYILLLAQHFTGWPPQSFWCHLEGSKRPLNCALPAMPCLLRKLCGNHSG
jgi:hypothetical protein